MAFIKGKEYNVGGGSCNQFQVSFSQLSKQQGRATRSSGMYHENVKEMCSPAGSHQSQTGMGTWLLHTQQEHSWVWDTAKELSGKQAPEREGEANQFAEQGTTTSHHEILSVCPATPRPTDTFSHGPLGHLPLSNPTPVPVPSSDKERCPRGTAQATVLRSGLLQSAKAQV